MSAEQRSTEMALGHITVGIGCCLTIIGIPLGIAHFKLVPISLLPMGKHIVDNDAPTPDCRADGRSRPPTAHQASNGCSTRFARSATDPTTFVGRYG